jgi:glucose/arabinose dehydrogenase
MIKLFRILGIFTVCALALGAISTSPALAASATTTPPTLAFTTVVSGLTNPVFVTNAGDGSNRLFIVQQTGQILIFKNGSLNATPFLDISSISNFTDAGGEQGLLGLAFDPNYKTNGYFYIAYTTTTGNAACPYVPTTGDTCPYATTLARYHVSSNADRANSTSGLVIISALKRFTNHNGGMVAFGPDGYLYMGIGDGGSGGDPNGNGQSLDTLSGKLLRLDVDGTPDSGKNYAIPHTNPYYGNGDPNVRQEIWAYGLRNPWRFSFDRSTGDLYIGDVGQDTQEEVDYHAHSSAGGQNYGWNCREGNLIYNSNCTTIPHYVPPVATYNHGTNDSYGCALTGGYVYRGSVNPSLQGIYFYGDYCSGKVLGLVKNSSNTWTANLLATTSYNISSFGEDEKGELYLTDLNGRVVKISSYRTIVTASFNSQANSDGSIIESAPSSGTGGSFNSSSSTLILGDSADNRQYRVVLSFNTSSLPDTAVITSAILKLRLVGISHTSPFAKLGNLLVDMAVPYFGTSSALQALDFQAASTRSSAAVVNPVPANKWYSAALSNTSRSTVNLSGVTQFRLEFQTPTNNNSVSNYASFYSGNSPTVSYRPILIVQYYVP